MFREAVLSFLGLRDDAQAKRSGQGIGEYCLGEHVDECRATFGDALARVCSTCPA